MIRLQRLEDLENGVFDTDKSATDKDKDILLIDLLDELTDKREAYLTLKSILVAQNKKYKVSEYTPKLVNEFIKFISGEKKCGCTTKLKNSSIIEYVHLLKSLFYYAIRKGIINCNPVCMIEKSDLPKKINKEPTYLTEDEIQLLIKTDCDRQDLKRAFLFSICTGLRISDIKTLEWNHLVEENGTTFIRKRMIKIKTKII